MEVMQPNQIKIKQLFDKFLEPDFQIKNDSYLNRLLTHLSNQKKTDDSQEFFTKWLMDAITVWSRQNFSPPPNIAAFLVNLTSLLSQSASTFHQLNSHHYYTKLMQTFKIRQMDADPSIKVAYIRFLTICLEHEEGLSFVTNDDFWKDVIRLVVKKQTIYIKRDGYHFLAKLLEQSDADFCRNVIKQIMLPLSENTFQTIKNPGELMEISDEVVYQNLSPTLEVLGHILEHFLENVLIPRNDSRVVSLFLKDFHLEQLICNFMMIAQNKLLFFDLGKIIFILQFLEMYLGVMSGSVPKATAATSVRKIMSIYTTNISKGHFENVLKLCYFGQFYWNLMGYKVPCMQVTKSNEPISFANQLLVIQLLPISAIAMKFCADNVKKHYNSDPFRDEYIQKLFILMCENTVRIAYSWRDFLIAQPNLFEIATKSLIYIMQTRKYYPRERAAMAFQAFVYTLKDITNAIKESPEKFVQFGQHTNFYSLLFDAFVVFIEEFHITWRDSVETICVMSISFDFLSMPMWPTQLVVKALKLVNVSLVKYMSPALALLVDTTNDTTLAVLGPLLCLKLCDMKWEVRDSALEVVCTIAHMASTKFPSLQKVLMDADLPSLVVKMSANDSESFVRATAIKCLQEMIQVEEIWTNSLRCEDLPQKMRNILLNETEGIVRVEAATFMCVAYENQQLPKETLDAIYETMVYSSTNDLHWEVKVRALKFWDKVIKNHLQHQGMIDGTFPNVTFSKEHRKIVTLTDSEIRKRLLKVLNQLSTTGCLGVLTTAIKDDCDMEVSKTAVKITQRLMDLFKKYNLTSDCSRSAPTSPALTENGTSGAISMSSGGSVEDEHHMESTELNEEVIEQIVAAKDVNLLKSVYSPSDYGSVSNYDIQVRKIVSPNEFLRFTQQDLNEFITEKTKWLNGIEDLGSLLDDMLQTYDGDGVNGMDCY